MLLFGPLYHLTEAADRRQALGEARRVLAPGGRLLAMAVCRFASLLDGLYEGWLDDPDFRPIVDQDLQDGQHRNPDPVGRPEFFTTAYFHTPDGLAAEILIRPAVRPCHSPIDSPAVQAGRRAMERAFGREVLFTKEGGSGPEADLAEILDAPLVFVAVGLDSDRIHAPNESMDITLLQRGAEASAYLWDELATAGIK